MHLKNYSRSCVVLHFFCLMLMNPLQHTGILTSSMKIQGSIDHSLLLSLSVTDPQLQVVKGLLNFAYIMAEPKGNVSGGNHSLHENPCKS